MELRTLKYFLTVAEEESLTRAAEVLHTSQPNLSKQLGDLEREVGHRLFVRGKRKVSLTEEGMFLRKRAYEIVSLSERTEAELSSFGEGERGDVYLASVETRGMAFVGKALASLKEKSPRILVHVHSESVKEIEEGLERGLFDFGLVVEPFDLAKYNYVKLPVKDTWGLLMRRDSPLSEKEKIAPADLEGLDLFFAEQQASSNILSGLLEKDMKNARSIGTFNLVTNPSFLVEEGLGSLVCFSGLVNTEGRNLAFREFAPSFETSLFLIWKKYQTLSGAKKAFLDEVGLEISRYPQGESRRRSEPQSEWIPNT